jgi:hypothetical protein
LSSPTDGAFFKICAHNADWKTISLYMPYSRRNLFHDFIKPSAMQIQEGRVTEARIAFSAASADGFKIVTVSVDAGARRTT